MNGDATQDDYQSALKVKVGVDHFGQSCHSVVKHMHMT
jgi:hypothetical protein